MRVTIVQVLLVLSLALWLSGFWALEEAQTVFDRTPSWSKEIIKPGTSKEELDQRAKALIPYFKQQHFFKNLSNYLFIGAFITMILPGVLTIFWRSHFSTLDERLVLIAARFIAFSVFGAGLLLVLLLIGLPSSG